MLVDAENSEKIKREIDKVMKIRSENKLGTLQFSNFFGSCCDSDLMYK